MTQGCISWKEGSGTRSTALTCFGFIFSLFGQRYVGLPLAITFRFQYLHPLSISLFASKVINSFTPVHRRGSSWGFPIHCLCFNVFAISCYCTYKKSFDLYNDIKFKRDVRRIDTFFYVSITLS